MYDRYSKLIYLIDASGSMGQGMKAEEEKPAVYNWTPEILKEAREFLIESIADGESFLEPSSGVDLTAQKVKKLTDEEVKEVILDHGIEDELGVALVEESTATKSKSGPKSKMMAVKEAAREFVKRRFQKYPDAQVLLFSFETQTALLSGGGAEKDILAGIDTLPDYGGGGTDIYHAVSKAVEHCKKRPSNVGVHHIVLVTDGMDLGALNVKSLLTDMKEIGIVLDFIFIKGGLDVSDTDPVIVSLQKVCNETGGAFNSVTYEKDFSQKFLAISERKCLPPAPKEMK